MKVLSLLFLVISSIATSQNTDLIVVEYDEIISYVPKIVNNDSGLLVIDQENQRSFYSVKIEDSPNKLANTSDDATIYVPAAIDQYFYENIINEQTNKLTENKFERYGLKKLVSVSEPTPIFNWQITSIQTEFAGYNCTQAITTFRGRTYKVLYTTDILVSRGPWKFQGLPGLILSVEDNSGIFKWKARRINFTKEFGDVFIDFQKRMNEYPSFSYEKLDKAIIDAVSIRMKAQKSRAGSRNYSARIGFTTSEWLEPINAWRQQTDFSF